MEKLIADITAYAAATDRKPQWVLRQSYGAGWGVWAQWCAGEKSPTVAVADRIYAFMAANPPKPAEDARQEDAA